jgi:hypothetical protein
MYKIKKIIMPTFLFQEYREHGDDPGPKFDGKLVRDWINDFNKQSEKLRNMDDVSDVRDKLLDTIMAYMNNFFSGVSHNGKPAVIEEWVRTYVPPGEHKVVSKKMFILRKPRDLVEVYRRFKSQIEGLDDKPVNIMTRWLNNDDTNWYEEMELDPSSTRCKNPDIFNMFRGLAISRDKAESSIHENEDVNILCKPITDHILKIWCRSNKGLGEYLLDWMAHAVQKPWIKLGTTPVLRGGQGSGKGIIIQMLGDILGQVHFSHATDMDVVVGRFQGNDAKTNLLTFLDECTFSGDKKQSSILKGLISEKMRKWEKKFLDPLHLRSFSNYIVASNYEQIVSVECDDRRFICIEVDDKYAGPQKKESAAYFNNLLTVKIEHFAAFLYRRDLSQFNPKELPDSVYNVYQKIINLDSIDVFIYELIKDWKMKFSPESCDERGRIKKKNLYNRYEEKCRSSGYRFKHAAISSSFFMRLRKVLPSAVFKRGVVEFQHIDKCKQDFANYIKEPNENIDWDDHDDGADEDAIVQDQPQYQLKRDCFRSLMAEEAQAREEKRQEDLRLYELKRKRDVFETTD